MAVSAPSSPTTDARTTPLAACHDVTRFFGGFVALRGISFSLPPGQLWGLFGANGAGKSTLLRILAGVLRASSGSVFVAGERVPCDATRRATGLLSHESFLHPVLTVAENLRCYAALYNLAQPASAARDALGLVRGEALATWRVGELSQGMRQKAALARAVLHAPRLLLLDEPFASLDRATVTDLQATLQSLRAAGLALLVSTHTESLITDMLDGRLTLERGRLVDG